MESIVSYQTTEIGTYDMKLIKHSKRLCISYQQDAAFLFEGLSDFYVSWSIIGEELIFYPFEEKYAKKTSITRGKYSLQVPIPLMFSRRLGLDKRTPVKVKFIKINDKIGFTMGCN